MGWPLVFVHRIAHSKKNVARAQWVRSLMPTEMPTSEGFK